MDIYLIKKKMKIPKSKLIKIEKAANRAVHIELGITPPKSAVYKNKKKYTRKSKHSNIYSK